MTGWLCVWMMLMRLCGRGGCVLFGEDVVFVCVLVR